MTIDIKPKSAVTGTDNPSAQISVDEVNNGFQKIVMTGPAVIGKSTSGAGDATEITTLPADVMPALTGDVTTSAGAVATTIANNAVSLAKMATVATASVLGRTTAGTGNIEALTATQATALLNNVVGDSGSGGTKGLVPAPASGDAAAQKYLKADGTWSTPSGSGPVRAVGITIDGGGSAITTGTKGFIRVPYAGTLAEWSIVADQSGSIVIDVWKKANAIPAVTETITASDKPTLSSAQINSSTALTGWTTSVAANDVFGFKVDSAATVTRVTIVLKLT
jgi:hypothetical protein